jgi:hypothetical protein
MTVRPRLVLAALLAAALAGACTPGVPRVTPDDDPIDAGDARELDAPVDAAPIVPPGQAMETLSGAGRVTAGDLTLDIVLGGAPRGRTSDGTHTLDAAPVLR